MSFCDQLKDKHISELMGISLIYRSVWVFDPAKLFENEGNSDIK
jgi:hypothetical protein